MWRNFRCLHMTDVEKSEFLYVWHVCGVGNVAIYAKFIAIYAVLLLNRLFTLFCCKIFATIYVLSCGEKLSPKVYLWRKRTNMRSTCIYLKDSITSGLVGAFLACRGVALGDPHLLHSLTVSCHCHAGIICH